MIPVEVGIGATRWTTRCGPRTAATSCRSRTGCARPKGSTSGTRSRSAGRRGLIRQSAPYAAAWPVHELTRADARRIAVRAQRLTASGRPTCTRRSGGLSLLQLEPTSAVAPSAELVLWSRLGSAYRPAELRDALDELRLDRAARDAAGGRGHRALPRRDGGVAGHRRPARLEGGSADWVHDNNACRRDILERLRADGPLHVRDLPDTCVRPWKSTGGTTTATSRCCSTSSCSGGRSPSRAGQGRDRLWDLAARVYPDDPPVPLEEARLLRDERRLGALGIARSRGPSCPVEPLDVGEAGEPAVVEGVRGEWRVDPALVGQPFEGRAALLSPFDRMIHDRKRMAEVFEFDYVLEMYKPADERRWGYYALPILYGDRLVGKLDAKADRRARRAPGGRGPRGRAVLEGDDPGGRPGGP